LPIILPIVSGHHESGDQDPDVDPDKRAQTENDYRVHLTTSDQNIAAQDRSRAAFSCLFLVRIIWIMRSISNY